MYCITEFMRTKTLYNHHLKKKHSPYNGIEGSAEFISICPDIVISEKQPIWKQETGPWQQHRCKRSIVIIIHDIVISEIFCTYNFLATNDTMSFFFLSFFFLLKKWRTRILHEFLLKSASLIAIKLCWFTIKINRSSFCSWSWQVANVPYNKVKVVYTICILNYPLSLKHIF
jgi:hypothetical protein